MTTSQLPPALECPTCGTVVANQDFCPCGEYLAWEVTLQAAPAGAPVVIEPPKPAELRAATLLTLRDPARDDEPGAAVAVSVVPGAEVTILATVRNQGEITDTFDLRVTGLPEAWFTVSPATVFLNPWGSSGDYEQVVQVRLHPPRTPESEARDWPLAVVARSRSRDADVASAPATLAVRPFQSTVMQVAPERRRGRRHASFDVTVANHGNSPLEIHVRAQDSEARCPIRVASQRATVPVGESGGAVVRVGVPRPLIFGRPIDHAVEITHHATGVESETVPQRVTFRQKPWLPWWIPPVVGLLAAFAVALLVLGRQPEVPKLEGDTVDEALVVLKKRHLRLGRTTYAASREHAEGTIIHQEPAAGADIVKGERVNVTLAAPPQVRLVPRLKGRTVGEAAALLDRARFGSTAQPPSAGEDWIVIRQDPAAGSEQDLGTKVTLAAEAPTPEATPTPSATPTPTPTPTPTATPAQTKKKQKQASAAKPVAKPVKATTAAAGKLPADFVFAGATSGQLYAWPRSAAKAKRLTSPRYRLETPAKVDDGYVAVHVEDAVRRLVTVSADGRRVTPLAEGDYHRPAFSPSRGLLAMVANDDRGGPADAGRLCVMEPQDGGQPACARTRGHRIGRPAWAPDGRSVLALAAGPDGEYDEVLLFTAHGGDARRWDAPLSIHEEASIQSAVWLGGRRIALLLADRPGAAAHVRVLSRRSDGSFKRVKDFPALTGWELAAAGDQLALRRGAGAGGDGAIVLLDVDRKQPRVRTLANGVNPAWAH